MLRHEGPDGEKIFGVRKPICDGDVVYMGREPTLLAFRQRGKTHVPGEESLKRLVRAVGVLASGMLASGNESEAWAPSLRGEKLRDVYVRVPVKPGRLGEASSTGISSYGGVAKSHWELLMVVVELFAPTHAMVEREDGSISIEGSGNVIILCEPGDPHESAHAQLDAAVLLRGALTDAGVPADKVERLLGGAS